jgi:hypothetical protein
VTEERFRLGKAWRERYDDAIAHGATMSEAIHAANNPRHDEDDDE